MSEHVQDSIIWDGSDESFDMIVAALPVGWEASTFLENLELWHEDKSELWFPEVQIRPGWSIQPTANDFIVLPPLRGAQTSNFFEDCVELGLSLEELRDNGY